MTSDDAEAPDANGRPTRARGLLQGLQDRIGATARVESVFGEPRDVNGVQIIPVARVMYGFGAGTGLR